VKIANSQPFLVMVLLLLLFKRVFGWTPENETVPTDHSSNGSTKVCWGHIYECGCAQFKTLNADNLKGLPGGPARVRHLNAAVHWRHTWKHVTNRRYEPDNKPVTKWYEKQHKTGLDAC
jgi:hypothetical protein